MVSFPTPHGPVSARSPIWAVLPPSSVATRLRAVEVRRWVDLAKKRLQSVLGRHTIATSRTLESKISNAGPYHMRVEPLPLTTARRELQGDGRIVPSGTPASRGSTSMMPTPNASRTVSKSRPPSTKRSPAALFLSSSARLWKSPFTERSTRRANSTSMEASSISTLTTTARSTPRRSLPPSSVAETFLVV